MQSGCFGAGTNCKDPRRVADCIAEMCVAVKLPITVKTRIGVDDCESYDYLAQFIQQVSWRAAKLLLFMRVKLGYRD